MANGKKITKKTSEKTKDTQQNAYSIVLSFGEYEYKSSGDTIENALENLKPEVLKSSGRLVVSNGKESTEIVVYPRQVRRLMSNKFCRIFLAKRLSLMIK
jgi:hypothetical protein